jgi:glycosyltransferase involved in cell wall biosynthesis
LSTRIVCNATALEEILVRKHGVDRQRIAVIPNGVDVDYFQPRPEMRSSQPTIIFAGRLVDQKDPLNLLKGFRMVTEKLPEARLIVLGNGHLQDAMQAFIRSNGLQSRVSLLPGICDIRSHLRRAWVFALPSRYEGLPNAVLEAMAVGLPVVATSVGGVPEILRDGQTGLLVEPEDPVGLARALTGLLQNQSRREAMGEKARKTAARVHSLDKMVSEAERLIAGAVNQNEPACGKPSSFISK